MSSTKPLSKRAEKYIEKLSFIDPRALVIQRYEPSGHTAGGLIKPQQYHDREVRSTMWGKVLMVSGSAIDDDPLTMEFKKNIQAGDWVMFLPNNTINGGLPGENLIQMTAFTDVKGVLSEEDFLELIKDQE